MNITQENIDDLNVTLSVEISPEDYEERVTKILRDYRKKAVMDGFRPGKVPFGLIKKLHRVPVLVDEVNKILNESITNYVQENKLDILGEPLPNEEKKEEFDWEKQDTFRFFVDLGLSPKLEINLTKKIKVPYYKIKIDDELRKETINSYLAQLGEMKSVDEVGEKDMLDGKLTETDTGGNPVEKGIHIEEAVINMPDIKDEETKNSLLGKHKGDKVLLEIKHVYPGEEERAAALKTDRKNLEEVKPYFLLEIKDIRRFHNAEENQEFYDKLFGKDVVKTHEEFIEKIDDLLRHQLDGESNMRYQTEVRRKLISLINPPLPEAFLKRWLIAVNKEKFTPEQIEKEFDLFLDDLKWQLIRDKIAEMAEIKVGKEELREYAMAVTREQFRQYGMGYLPDEQIAQYAEERLKKEEDYNRFASGILNNKVFDHLKTVIKLDEKEISRKDFFDMIEKEEKAKKEKN
ncbi:MAG TPA: trigger factor [Bacteroidetes bacterium]|nr:trigger factor [Bacteroidota bacterium]